MADQTKVAVVTGAARGIGRASAISLARKGFAVGIVDRLEGEMAGTVEEIRALGGDAMLLPGSVADYATVIEHGPRVCLSSRADIA